MRTAFYKLFCVLGIVFLLLSMDQQQAPITAKAQSFGWSIPQTIPGYNPATWPPILIADQNRTVHAFSTQPVDAGGGEIVQAVFYNRWTLAHGWTFPTDIILSPLKDARVTDAYLDGKGIFHVLFYGGDNTGADIYYSQAPAANADDPNAWSAPIIIGEEASDPEGAVFYEDDRGTLYVMYNGRRDGSGIYVVSSKDGGSGWSNPAPVFLANDQSPIIIGLHVIRSKSGWFHAIWNTRNVGGQGRGLYYTQSKDGMDWSDPILLDRAQSGYGVLFPTIIEYQGSLFVNYIQTPKIMMRFSRDDGQSWEDPAILFSRHVGVNGGLSLVVDGKQELHLFFGQRIDATTTSPEISGMWHSEWVNGRWTEPEAVAKGPGIADQLGDKSFDPYEARAVVSQGNVVLVTWRTDPGPEKLPNGVWYSYAVLRAPESAVTPLATAAELQSTQNGTAAATFAANSAPTQGSVPDVTRIGIGDNAKPNAFGSPAQPLAVGLISSVLILLVVIGSFISGSRQ